MKPIKLLFLLVAIFMLVGCKESNEYSKEVDRLVYLLNNSDFKGAYDLIDFDQESNLVEDEYFENLMEKLNTIEEYQIEKNSGEGNLYQVNLIGKVADQVLIIDFENQVKIIDDLSKTTSNFLNEDSLSNEIQALDRYTEILLNEEYDEIFDNLESDISQVTFEESLNMILEYSQASSLKSFTKEIERKENSVTIIYSYEKIHFLIELAYHPENQKIKIYAKSLEVLNDLFARDEVLLVGDLYLEEDDYTIRKNTIDGDSKMYNDAVSIGTLFNQLVIKGDLKEAYGYLNDAWIRSFSLEEFARYVSLNIQNSHVSELESFEGYGTTLNPLNPSKVFLNTFMRINNTEAVRLEYHTEIENKSLEMKEPSKISNLYFQKFKNRSIVFDEYPRVEASIHLEKFINSFATRDINKLKSYGYNSLSQEEFEELFYLQEKLVGNFVGSYKKYGTYKTRSKDYWITELLYANNKEVFRIVLTQNREGKILHYCVLKL